MTINNKNLAEKTRNDFPLFSEETSRGKRFIYLDHAATSQKPYQVIKSLQEYYRNTNAFEAFIYKWHTETKYE